MREGPRLESPRICLLHAAFSQMSMMCPYTLKGRNFCDGATRSNAPSPAKKNVSVLPDSGTEAGAMPSLTPCANGAIRRRVDRIQVLKLSETLYAAGVKKP